METFRKNLSVQSTQKMKLGSKISKAIFSLCIITAFWLPNSVVAANLTTSSTSSFTMPLCGFIYVSTDGDDTSGTGTSDYPYKTLNKAMSVAVSGSIIRMKSGIYNEILILAMKTGVTIEGGFERTGTSINNYIWTKTSVAASATTINFSGTETIDANTAHVMGIKAVSVNSWALQDLTITTAAASGQTTSGKGKSNYAVYINGCTDYKITRCNITTGNASAGLNGAAGNAGGAGGTGGFGGYGADTKDVSIPGTGGYGGAGGAGGAGGGIAGGYGGYGGNGSDDNSTHTYYNNDGGYYGFSGASTSCASGGGGSPYTNNTMNSGSNGSTCSTNGSIGNAGSVGTATIDTYFVPGSGTNGGGGTAGVGGGGGGGGGSNTTGQAASGSGGSGGGGGGGSGSGGIGAQGGGSTFGIYIYSSTGEVTGNTILSGTAGAAGIGGSGGSGGSGGYGNSAVPYINNSSGQINGGGAGGNGSAGGAGGKGGNGSAGISAQVYSSGVGSSSPTASIPNPTTLTINYTRGNADNYIPGKSCVNSETELTAASLTSGNWVLPTGVTLVNDLSATTSSYTLSSTAIRITASTAGVKDLTVNGGLYKNYLNVASDARTLPVIVKSASVILVGETIDLSVTNSYDAGSILEYEWLVYASSPTDVLFSRTTSTFTTPAFATVGNYNIRYRERHACCGWSTPVFSQLTVNPLPPTIISISATSGSITGGTSVIITGTNLTAATSVKFGTNDATNVTLDSSTQITATSPAGVLGAVDVTVTTAGGTSATSSADLFTYTAPTTISVVSTAGGLSTAITSADGNLSTVTNLTISGSIDATDFKAMRDNMPALKVVDMSAVTIAAYTGTEGTGGSSSISYPNNEIPELAFYNNSTSKGKPLLTSFTMPTSITTIGSYAFYYSTSLASASISAAITSIGNYAFVNCSALINVDADNANYSSSEGVLYDKLKTTIIQVPISKTESFSIPSSVTTIGNYAFFLSTINSSLTLPESIITIGENAFNNSKFTGTLTIPSSVKYIYKDAFNGCNGLSGDLYIPSSVIVIGESAFKNCSGFKGGLTISPSINTINIASFSGCSGLTGILTIPSSVTSIGNYAFYGCTGLSAITIPASVTSIGGSAFYGCRGLTAATIPASVTSIGTYAFYGCTGLSAITIAASVTSIGMNTFTNCSGLTSITIPTSVTSIGSAAFQGCSGLIAITIPASVTTIAYNAFYSCSGLTTLTIPSSVTSIGSSAFFNCTKLTTINTYSATPVSLAASTNVFGSVPNTCVLHVIVGSKNAYKDAVQWKNFTNITEDLVIATFSTQAVSNIGLTTATGNAIITGLGLDNPTQYGVVWSTATNPTVALATKTAQGAIAVTGQFTSDIIGLTANTIYYLRPYATNSTGTYYGPEVSFTTLTAPTITSILPTNGSTIGGTLVTITGTYLTAASSVKFGTTNATNITEVSSTQITATSPAGSAGAVDITVTTPGGTSETNASDQFTYVAAPTITGISTTSGPTAGGTTVIITGTNLTAASAVKFGATNATSFTFTSATEITATSPAGNAGAVDVTVTTPGGTSATSSSTKFSYTITVISTAGGLSTAITTAGGNLSSVTNLTITGVIDATDFKTMRDDMPLLAVVDMSPVTIATYTGTGGTGGTSSITYPANGIPEYAFYNNSTYSGSTTLTSFILPESATSIGNQAFVWCIKLNTIAISSSVNSIGLQAFNNCISLINVDESNPNYSSIDGVLYNKTKTTLIQCPTSKTGSFTFPSTVTIIGNYAFNRCNISGSLAFPPSLVSIGKFAFNCCSQLTGTFNFPTTLKYIYQDAFNGCYSFSGDLYIPSSVTYIGESAFNSCSGLNGNLTISPSINIIETATFSNCTKLTGNLIIPSAVTSIGYNAFYNCTGFNGVLILPDKLTIIGPSAFFNCSHLTGEINIPSLTTSITYDAFDNCSSFTGPLTIPSSVNNIGGSAFKDCSALTSIITNIATPILFTENYSPDVFLGINKTTCKLIVPADSYASYTTATQWKDFLPNIFAAPGAPTSVSATKGESSATVSFTAPASNGSAITSYMVTSSPGGISATGSASPITVTGLTNGTAYTFTVTATNEIGTSGASAASNSVTPNSAPTDISLSATAINENEAANSAVGTLSSTDPDAANTFTYTLVTGAGDTDNASFNISGSNLQIPNSPDFETKSSYSVRVRTTDQGNLTFEKEFTITINDVAESPTDIALSASAINENVAANSLVGALSSTDPDATNTFTYSLVAGTDDTDNAAFNINGSNLQITNSPDFETKNSYKVRIRTTDQGGLLYTEKAFTITINNVNETPTDIALSASAIDENVVANSVVGALSSTDPDATNTFTYTLVAGTDDTDNGAFNINGSNLQITNSPDFETKNSYKVRVRTTDQGGLIFEEAFTITINNVNETPTDIALSASAISENVVANSIVGTLSSTDPDATNTFTYTLVAGTDDTDNAAFNINGSNLQITNSPDFETKNSYKVRIRTTDQGGLLYTEKAFTITINNVNETPTDIALSASAIDENVVANSVVGTLSSTDPDDGNTFTYTLVTGDGSTDNTSFNISGSNLQITNSPDFETKNSYKVRVRTTDQGGLLYTEKAFTITINNVNETPTDIALSASAIDENVVANSIVGTLSSTDPDATNTFTYTLVAGTDDTDNGAFNINGSNLQITNSPDFETKNSYKVRVRTTDQGGLTFDEAFTITINNINEIPTDIALSASAIDENVVANSIVGTLSSTDPDATNTFTYTFVTGDGSTDNAAFNISENNLRITASPDFEAKSSYSVRVKTTDQGDLTFEKEFVITINNVDEAPIVTTNSTATNISATGATIGGTINANSISTTVTFQYGLDTSYGNIVTAAPSPITGTSNTAASYTLSGLALNTTYHYRVVGVNSKGTTLGNDMTFTTLDPMILTYNTAATGATGTSVTLPLKGTVNVSVDWGDGLSGIYISNGNVIHNYSVGGTYTINITGTLTGFGNTWGYTNANKLVSVTSFGNLGITNLSGAFSGATNLTSVPAFLPSSVTDLSNMFANATQFNGDISKWNVSNVTNMSYMFYGAKNFNNNIGGWSVKNVTNMAAMFYYASVFNQDISLWETNNVTNMSSMFNFDTAFNQNIGGWTVSKVTDMSLMFSNASAFNKNIGGWTVSNVTDMSSMFAGASIFNQNLNNWTTSNVTNMSQMFKNASAFNGDISNWDVKNVTDMGSMFSRAFVFNQSLFKWTTGKVTKMNHMFNSAKVFNGDISSWDVGNVTDMSYMFISSFVFNQDISKWNTAKVTDMSYMFNDALKFNQDIGGWTVNNVTNMNNMFNNANAFNKNIANWSVNNVTNMNSMFNSAYVFNQNIGGWNVSNVTDMGDMFSRALVFNQNISAWNISNVTNMSNMFNFATLSITNYNALLTGWAKQEVKSGIKFHGGYSKYNSGDPAAARFKLTDTKGWVIIDGGVANELPTITTQAVSSIGTNTATGNGNITSLGVPNPTAYGVCWNTTGTPTTSDSKTDKGAASDTGAFASSITNLSENTSYYVRAYATNTAGTNYGDVVIFKTYSITLLTANNIKLTTVTLGATIAPADATVQESGIYWSTTSGVSSTDNKTSGSEVTGGLFTVDVIGLTRSKTIYYKAYIVTTDGVTILSDEASFSNVPIFTETGNWEDATKWNVGEIPCINTKSLEGNGANDDSPVINASCALSSSYKCTNLTINSGKTLTINAGSSLSVLGTLTNNAGADGLVIKSTVDKTNGSLIYATGSPSATVEMYSKAYWNLEAAALSRYNWQFFGIPVKTLAYNDAFSNSIVRKYNETATDNTALWEMQLAGSSLTSGTGYEIVQAAGKTYSFKGELTNAAFIRTLPYTTNAKYPGQHIFGNPYTAAIDIKQIVFGDNTEASVYLYNTGTYNNWSTTSTYSGTTTLAGQYTVSTIGTAGESEVPGQIPSMQGFLVKSKASDGLITIPYSAVASNVSNSEMQRTPQKVAAAEKVITRIDVTSAHAADRMWIFTEPTSTRKFDNGWDGYKIMGSALNSQLFAMEKDGNYQIDAVPDINDTYLGFQAGMDTEFTLKFTQQNITSAYSKVYLMDLVEGDITDITADGSEYSFSAESTPTPIQRFKIVTSTGSITGKTGIADGKINVFNSNETLFIENFSDQKGTLILYDMKGIAVKAAKFDAYKVTYISTQGLTPGAYLAKTGNGINQVTAKIIIR